jgi:hypothetical protein
VRSARGLAALRARQLHACEARRVQRAACPRRRTMAAMSPAMPAG